MAFVSILVVDALMGLAALVGFAVPAATSARSTMRAVAGARAQLTPAVSELAATARAIAERLQRLRPEA